MHLLWFNLATDLDDPILAFTSSWIRAVAKRVDSIHVVTMRCGRVKPPKNVRIYSVGKEKGFSEPRRVLEFYRHLLHILRGDAVDVCFSHMIPIFSVLAAPVLKTRRIPILSWYAHRQKSFTLKLAHCLSDRMVSINRSSYPYPSDKTMYSGHGIDTELFAPNKNTLAIDPPLILFAGRLSPIKDPVTFIRAARLLGNQLRFQVALIGPLLEADSEYSRILMDEFDQLRKTVPSELIRGVSQTQLVDWYQRAFAVVNCSPPDHSLDKTVLEAMACAKPALSSTLGYKETMGRETSSLLFHAADPEDLAAKLRRLLKLPAETVQEMGLYLREQTVKNHSLRNLAENLTALLYKLTG